MSPTELWVICASAFLAVFVLLTVLAVVMRLIIMIFPEKQQGTDVAMLAAVTTTAQATFPGMRVTKVEEIKSYDGVMSLNQLLKKYKSDVERLEDKLNDKKNRMETICKALKLLEQEREWLKTCY